MSKEITSDAPKTHSDIGQWITRCGPKGKSSTFGLVILFGFMLAGFFCLIVGITMTPMEGSEALNPVFIGLGIAMLAIGFLCLLFMALWKNPQVDLYSNGIRFMKKGNEHFIGWGQMQNVKVTTIYDTRFSHFRTVKITIAGHKDLEFDSKLEGQPDRIIDGILQHAPDVEQAEIDMGASNEKMRHSMKTMQRFWYFILGIGITALGGYVIVEDPTMRITGIIAVVVGIAVTGAMGYILFGQKNSE